VKWGDIRDKRSGDMTAMVCKDKHHVFMLTNIHNPAEKGNFCDESENALMQTIMEDQKMTSS
jgi:hypothetical protein